MPRCVGLCLRKSQVKILENFGTQEFKQGPRCRNICSPSLNSSHVVVPGSRGVSKHRVYCYSRAGGRPSKD